MWKAQAGHNVGKTSVQSSADDDWETEPDFVNDISEKEQRWGSKSVAGSGRQASIDMASLREEVTKINQEKELSGPKASYGYGGKFGVERDRMDKSAVGHDHVEVQEKHASQKDYSSGFGGKYGVQHDRQDRSAVGWEHKEAVEKHVSQKDYTSGFGGKFGVQSDRQDKSAVGWDHKEVVAPHPSQQDYSAGFGGKFGVLTDRQDKSAVGWDHTEQTTKHSSQTDYAKGFGGRYGVQTDCQDASSVGHDAMGPTERHPSQITATPTPKPAGGLGSLRARFEAVAASKTDRADQLTPAQRRVAEERANWQAAGAATTTAAAAAAMQPESPPTQPQIVPAAVPPPSSPPAYIATQINEPATTGISLAGAENLLSKVNERQADSTAEHDTWDEPEVQPSDFSTAVALYDYAADEDDELTFAVGELITEIEKVDAGWWKGVCRGKVGLFPANYVQEQVS